MPDISPLLIRRCIEATGPSGHACAQCRRTPLAGERLHHLESGHVLCTLCFGALPDAERVAVTTARVSAGERPLAVGPIAA
jgi:hypothetical protein